MLRIMAGVQDRVLACRPLPVSSRGHSAWRRQQLMRSVEDPFVLDKSVTSWASMSSHVVKARQRTLLALNCLLC